MDDEMTEEEACDLGWSIAMLGRGYAAVVDPVFAELPRGARGYQLLHTVIHKNIRSQIALADYLGVDRTVMPYVIDDLQAAGYVLRRDDPKDRRIRTVTATPEGIARYKAITDEVRRAERILLETLDDTTRPLFVETLSALARHSRTLSPVRPKKTEEVAP